MSATMTLWHAYQRAYTVAALGVLLAVAPAASSAFTPPLAASCTYPAHDGPSLQLQLSLGSWRRPGHTQREHAAALPLHAAVA
jgi:hypothetical protein